TPLLPSSAERSAGPPGGSLTRRRRRSRLRRSPRACTRRTSTPPPSSTAPGSPRPPPRPPPRGPPRPRPTPPRPPAPRPTCTPPRCEPATATAQQPPASFVEHLHPGDVNADAIQHWAWVAAHAPASADARPVSATTDNLEPFHDLAYLHDTSHGAVRPRIAELLTGSHPARLGSQTIHVGTGRRAARDLLADQMIESKARRYRQAETAAERTRSEQSGWFVALGPEGGAPMGPQASAVTRAPYERKEVTGTKASAKDNSTHETNKEGTLRFRHFTFDVTLVARRATAARTILRVDVPNGLTGALPVEGSGLVGGLDALVGELLSAREAEPPPTTAVSARTGSEVVWRASSHSDGVACVSATVVLLRPRRQIGSS